MNHAMLGLLTRDGDLWVGWPHLPELAALAELPPQTAERAVEVVPAPARHPKLTWRKMWRRLSRQDRFDWLLALAVITVFSPLLLASLVLFAVGAGWAAARRRVCRRRGRKP